MYSWLSNNFFTTSISRLVLSVEGYLSGNKEEGWDDSRFIETLENGEDNEETVDCCEKSDKNHATGNNEDLAKEKEQPNITINIQNSKNGTVVVGDGSSINYSRVPTPSSGIACQTRVNLVSGKKEISEPCRSEPSNVQHKNSRFPVKDLSKYVTSAELVLLENNDQRNENCRRKLRKKKRSDFETTNSKVSSFIKRIKFIQDKLSQCRENGEWETHDKTIENLMKDYKYDPGYYDPNNYDPDHYDPDHYDLELQLKYEIALGLYTRNQNNATRKTVREVAEEIKAVGISAMSDTQKQIYFRCFLLASDINCRDKKFGSALKALENAGNFLTKNVSSNGLLKAEFFLASARYHLQRPPSSLPPLTRVKIVIEETNKAEEAADILKKGDYETWEKTRRQILLTRARAIIEGQIREHIPNNFRYEISEQLTETLTTSLDEIELQLWDGILSNNEVCDCFSLVYCGDGI